MNPTNILYIPILTTLHFVRQQLLSIRRDSWQPVSHIVWYLPSPITRYSMPPENGYQNMICIVNFFKDCLEKIVLHFNNVKLIFKNKVMGRVLRTINMSDEIQWQPTLCGHYWLGKPIIGKREKKKIRLPLQSLWFIFFTIVVLK